MIVWQVLNRAVEFDSFRKGTTGFQQRVKIMKSNHGRYLMVHLHKEHSLSDNDEIRKMHMKDGYKWELRSRQFC